MGLLLNQEVFSFEKIQQEKKNIKKRAAEQFIKLYRENANIQSSKMEVGYEVEMFICKRENGLTKLNLIADAVLSTELNLQVEFARYMIEFVPSKPFNKDLLKNLNQELIDHYEKIERHLLSFDSFPFMTTNFFFLGEMKSVYAKNNFCIKNLNLESRHFPEIAITPHNRFYSFAQSIKNYRGKKVFYQIDENVQLDSMGQGMGCNSLHITISLENLTDAMKIYDAFLFFAPLFLNLSAATPIVQSHLVSTDTRWNFLAASVDCKDEQYGRFSPPFFYLCNKNFNDFSAKISTEHFEFFKENGIPENLALMIANEFYFDPILSYELKEGEKPYADFENLHSSNWRSVRLKMPYEKKWLVEFRPMEMQMTPFENASYVIFIFTLSRVILKYDLNFYIPITKTLENYNFQTKFYTKCDLQSRKNNDFQLENLNEFFTREIPNMKKSLLDLIFAEAGEENHHHIEFLKKRICGEYKSNAEYIRDMVGQKSGRVEREKLEWLIEKMRRKVKYNDGEYLKK